METSTDEEEISDAWANFTTPSEHNGNRQSIPMVRRLSQVDKEDQEASSQQKVSPISTYLLYSLTLNFQRIFYQKITLSEWMNERSEFIEDPEQDNFELLDQENVNSDEEEESDDEYEPVYVEEEEEKEIDVDDEDIGHRVKRSDYFHDFEKKSNSRNYKQNNREIFSIVNTAVHPQRVRSPPKFERRGQGRDSVLQYKDKKAEEIADDLFKTVVEHTVKMYNLNLKEGVKRLSDAKLRAWLGIHFMTYAWRQPDLSRYWNSGEYAGQKIPDFSKIMPLSDFKEIRANMRFEDYRREEELKTRDKAWKVRTHRLFDCMINVLFQASYKVYKYCRDLKLGDEETLSHGEFNEKIIDHYLNNAQWKAEKEEATLGKRVTLRNLATTSNAPQRMDICFATCHDMATNKVRYGKDQRINRYQCAMCKIDPLEEPISWENRTLYYCVQCSAGAESTGEHLKRTYLHPECFGRYHRHMYNKVLGSSMVKGIVVS